MQLIQNQSIIKINQIADFAQIHQASAVIFERNFEFSLQNEMDTLLQEENFADLKLTEQPEKFASFLAEKLSAYPYLQEDLLQWIYLFSEQTESTKIKFLLSVVNSDMCRRFHTDVVDFRLLCTYAGIGTYYILPENAHFKTEEPAENSIEKLNIGDVMLFRGALSATADCPALLHKSPPAYTLGIKRLLLRLDTEANEWL
jgi:hypothetical protein